MRRWLAVLAASVLAGIAHLVFWSGLGAVPRFGPPPAFPPDAYVSTWALWPPGWMWFPVVLVALTVWAVRIGQHAGWRDRVILVLACLTAWSLVVHVSRSSVTAAVSVSVELPPTPEQP